jgi:hypothetical protein
MRFFADHCVPESITITLEAEGHEVLGQITLRLTTCLSNHPERAHYRGKRLLMEAHRIRIGGVT